MGSMGMGSMGSSPESALVAEEQAPGCVEDIAAQICRGSDLYDNLAVAATAAMEGGWEFVALQGFVQAGLQ